MIGVEGCQDFSLEENFESFDTNLSILGLIRSSEGRMDSFRGGITFEVVTAYVSDSNTASFGGMRSDRVHVDSQVQLCF